jgi:hypothetical protein
MVAFIALATPVADTSDPRHCWVSRGLGQARIPIITVPRI